MVDLKLQVTFDGKEYEVDRLTMGDFVALERQYGVAPAAMTNPKLEWIAFLAYRGLSRAGHIPADVEFESALDRMELSMPTEDSAGKDGEAPASSPET